MEENNNVNEEIKVEIQGTGAPIEEAKTKKNYLDSFVVKLAIFLVLAIIVGALGWFICYKYNEDRINYECEECKPCTSNNNYNNNSNNNTTITNSVEQNKPSVESTDPCKDCKELSEAPVIEFKPQYYKDVKETELQDLDTIAILKNKTDLLAAPSFYNWLLLEYTGKVDDLVKEDVLTELVYQYLYVANEYKELYKMPEVDQKKYLDEQFCYNSGTGEVTFKFCDDSVDGKGNKTYNISGYYFKPEDIADLYEELYNRKLEKRYYKGCPQLIYDSSKDIFYTHSECGGSGFGVKKYIYKYTYANDLYFVYFAVQTGDESYGTCVDLECDNRYKYEAIGSNNYKYFIKYRFTFRKVGDKYYFEAIERTDS